MTQFKHVLIMLIVAVLFSVLTYSIGTAIHEQPSYEDYCADHYRAPYKLPLENCTMPVEGPAEADECAERRGYLEPVIGPSGCFESYTCNTCNASLEDAQESFRLIIFLVMSLLGVAAIIIGILYTNDDEVLTWILNGFVLGGLISLFIGTIVYFSDAPRFARPIIILFELGLIILVAMRKMRSGKKKR
jgi:predicted membrane channel-forming protein YqfA (hemolysin III family)